MLCLFLAEKFEVLDGYNVCVMLCVVDGLAFLFRNFNVLRKWKILCGIVHYLEMFFSEFQFGLVAEMYNIL